MKPLTVLTLESGRTKLVAGEVERAGAYIARGIASVMALYDPECIILCDGVASDNLRFVAREAELSEKLTGPYFRNDLRIRSASLGEHSVIQVAALIASSKILAVREGAVPEAR
jgi:predicted NBD/HSP70 family sugar kinase